MTYNQPTTITMSRECRTCRNTALRGSRYCGKCWVLAKQNGSTSYLIADDRRMTCQELAKDKD